MCLKIADMLFGPSDALGFAICLFACDSHRFDTCLNELLISKYFLQNKYLIALNQQIGCDDRPAFQQQQQIQPDGATEYGKPADYCSESPGFTG